MFGGLQRSVNPVFCAVRTFSTRDEIPEAQILTGDQTFDDSEFQNWVS